MNTIILSNLKKIRTDKGWTQELLAELSGVSTRTLQRVESGGKTSIETAKSIASIFELDSYKELAQENALRDNALEQTSSPDDNVEQYSENENAVITPKRDSWWVRNIDYSAEGMCILVALALILLSVPHLLPESVGQDGKMSIIVAIQFFTSVATIGCLRALLRGVGLWDEICNTLRRYPEPINIEDTVNGLSLLVMISVTSLYVLTSWVNYMHIQSLILTISN